MHLQPALFGRQENVPSRVLEGAGRLLDTTVQFLQNAQVGRDASLGWKHAPYLFSAVYEQHAHHPD